MESVGTLTDKLSINELKIWHMAEQAARDDVDDAFRADCEARLAILTSQRDDLVTEIDQLLDDWRHGRSRPTVFRQMKMYNEKKFKD